MRARVDCIPCYLKQALSAIKEIEKDPEKQRALLIKTAEILPELTLEETPAGNSSFILFRVSELTGCPDPFKEKKHYYNQLALKLYPKLVELAKNHPDPLEGAVRIAAAGNVIDLGILSTVNIEEGIRQVMSSGLARNDYERFKEELKNAKTILYLPDNAGEIVFDRVLIEELTKRGKRVIIGVRETPILNDITPIDIKEANIPEEVEVIITGSRKIGTDLPSCSKRFIKIFQNSDIIIAKGQGNFETLSEERGPIYFLLKAKCPLVAEEAKVLFGDMIFARV